MQLKLLATSCKVCCITGFAWAINAHQGQRGTKNGEIASWKKGYVHWIHVKQTHCLLTAPLGDHSHSRGTVRTSGERMNIGYWLHHARKLNLSLNRVFGNWSASYSSPYDWSSLYIDVTWRTVKNTGPSLLKKSMFIGSLEFILFIRSCW